MVGVVGADNVGREYCLAEERILWGSGDDIVGGGAEMLWAR